MTVPRTLVTLCLVLVGCSSDEDEKPTTFATEGDCRTYCDGERTCAERFPDGPYAQGFVPIADECEARCQRGQVYRLAYDVKSCSDQAPLVARYATCTAQIDPPSSFQARASCLNFGLCQDRAFEDVCE
jgi:hypothetical protein